MGQLDGIWRLIESKAWNESEEPLNPPYGVHPMGQIVFSQGRMLASLCNGDRTLAPDQKRSFSSYGGLYQFDGSILTVAVDVASDPSRIGGTQVRQVIIASENRIRLLPPTRQYDNAVERRELTWDRVWRPQDEFSE